MIVSPDLLERFFQRSGDERFRRWFSVADAQQLADQLTGLDEVVADSAHVPAVVDDPLDGYLVALARHSGSPTGIMLVGERPFARGR